MVIVLAFFEDEDLRLLFAAKGRGRHLRKVLPEAAGCFDKGEGFDGLRDPEARPDPSDQLQALHQVKQAEEVLAIDRIPVAVRTPHHVVIEGNGERHVTAKDTE